MAIRCSTDTGLTCSATACMGLPWFLVDLALDVGDIVLGLILGKYIPDVLGLIYRKIHS